MAVIEWKSNEEIAEEQNKPLPPTVEELQSKIEQMEEEKKMTDLALLELTELILGRGLEGGEK